MCAQRVALTSCTDQFRELIQMIMEDEALEVPNTPDEAKALYIELLYQIGNLN
jgi:hypothetical protein